MGVQLVLGFKSCTTLRAVDYMVFIHVLFQLFVTFIGSCTGVASVRLLLEAATKLGMNIFLTAGNSPWSNGKN